jgi:hypothetical protein
LIDEIGVYGIRLTEIPQQSSPSTVSITEYITGGQEFSEVPFSRYPGPDEYRVDYGVRGKQSGLVQFSRFDDGRTVVVTYYGLGAVLSRENIDELIETNDSVQQAALDEIGTQGGSFKPLTDSEQMNGILSSVVGAYSLTWTCPQGVYFIRLLLVGEGGGNSSENSTFNSTTLVAWASNFDTGGGGGRATLNEPTKVPPPNYSYSWPPTSMPVTAIGNVVGKQGTGSLKTSVPTSNVMLVNSVTYAGQPDDINGAPAAESVWSIVSVTPGTTYTIALGSAGNGSQNEGLGFVLLEYITK